MKDKVEGEEKFYLDPEQAKKLELLISGQSFIYEQSGNPLQAKSKKEKRANQTMPDSDQKISIVVSHDGIFYGIPETKYGVMHHSTPVRGYPVFFAGEVAVDGYGRPWWFSNKSGHYLQGPYQLKLLLDFMIKEGLDVSKVYVSTPESLTPSIIIPVKFLLENATKDSTMDQLVLKLLIKHDPQKYFEKDINRPILLEYVLRKIHHMITVQDLSSYDQKEVAEKLFKWIMAYKESNSPPTYLTYLKSDWPRTNSLSAKSDWRDLLKKLVFSDISER